METTKKKRTREEVRAAFREYLDDKKKRMEEKTRVFASLLLSIICILNGRKVIAWIL